jgi:di/tricarboxylate transporter
MVSVPIISGNTAQNNCLAIFVAASLLWSTEAIPLFVTSLLVPLLVIVFQVEGEFKVLGGSDDPKKALAKHVFATMFSPTIMLLLGGFSIAAALSKVIVKGKNLISDDSLDVCSITLRKAWQYQFWPEPVKAHPPYY